MIFYRLARFLAQSGGNFADCRISRLSIEKHPDTKSLFTSLTFNAALELVNDMARTIFHICT